MAEKKKNSSCLLCRRASKTAVVLVLAALLSGAAPTPAHAFSTDIILLATQAMQRLQTGFMAAALTAGQVLQSKISENHWNSFNVNERTTDNAKTAAEIAWKSAPPKNFDACAKAKQMRGAAAVGNTAASIARAGAVSNNLIRASIEDVATMMQNRGKAGLVEKNAATTAMGIASDGSYGGSDLSIMSCFESSGMPMPPEYVPQKDSWTKIPEGVADKYKPWLSCYGSCLLMANSQKSVSRSETKMTPEAMKAIGASRDQIMSSAAQSMCMKNLLSRSRAESGKLFEAQKETCEKGQTNGDLGADPDGKEYDCSKGMSELQHAEASANCVSGSSCWQKKLAPMTQENRVRFTTAQAKMRGEVELLKWETMTNILSAMSVQRVNSNGGGAGMSIPVQ